MTLADTVDILIIGGGIVGLTTALSLRQAGLGVTLLERGRCGREASWAGAGIIAPPDPTREDPLFHIHTASIERYPALCAELQELSGVDTEYAPCGAVDLLTTEQARLTAERNVEAAADQRTPEGEPILEMVSAERALSLEPRLAGDAPAYQLCRRTAVARNPRLLEALRLSCEKVGVVIREGTAVVAFLMAGDRLTGVRTTDGDHHAKHTVLCAGAWSSQWAPPALAEMMPVHPVKGQIVLVKTDEAPISRVINMEGAYVVPRRDGRVLIGSTVEPEAGFDKRNTPKGVNTLITHALRMVPCLADAPIETMWAGLRPNSPDGQPFLGPVPGFDGLLAATAHFRSGLTTAPMTAEIIRDLVLTGDCAFDISWCKPGRSFGCQAGP